MYTYRSDNMQQDQTFLSLLSSQRQMMQQINLENAILNGDLSNYGVGGNNFDCQHSQGTTMDYINIYNNVIPQDPVPINLACSDFSLNSDVLLSRSYSLGFGGLDNYSLAGFPFDRDIGFFDKCRTKNDYQDYDADITHSKKRRLSNTGFMSTSIFDDHIKQDRRDSILTFDQDLQDVSNSDEDDDSLEHLSGIDEAETDILDGDAKSDPEVRSFRSLMESKKPQEQFLKFNVDDSGIINNNSSFAANSLPTKNILTSKLKDCLQAFTVAMERSQKSQQDIHNWDRRMGLKRSHSKTMRLSSRSRKKLRTVLKKEISAIVERS